MMDQERRPLMQLAHLLLAVTAAITCAGDDACCLRFVYVAVQVGSAQSHEPGT
jgi:hypothetical protein